MPEAAASPRTVLLSRPVLSVLIFVLLLGLLELTPGLERLRLIRREPAVPPPAQLASVELRPGEAELAEDSVTHSELAQPEHTTPERAAPGIVPAMDTSADAATAAQKSESALDDPSGDALAGFYAALDRVRNKQPEALVRIVHFGDSIVASDWVSGTLRRRLQEQFGDGGHGFSLIANAWPSYFHNDVQRYATSGWHVSRIVGPTAPDGLYGLGGVSFRAGPHALARVSTAKSGSYGRRVSRFVLLYLEQPGGGRIELRVDGRVETTLDTSGTVKRARFHELVVPDGAHEFELQTLSGNSRLFGTVLERAGPGVVLDAIGIQGARIRFLDQQDDAHWAEQLAWRKPSLLIYQFGANESADGFLYSMQDYERTMRDVLEQGQRAVPGVSCLVLGAMDRAAKQGDQLVSLKVLPPLIEQQKLAARDAGCAFFDTYRAMGGRGSMARWVKKGLGQADFTHPSGVGAEIIGNWIHRALLRGYERRQSSDVASKP